MEVRDLNVGDLLGLLESPQEEVVQEVRSLLKETFVSVREAWLVAGLLDYFYVSNSGRLLDLLVGVSEPHDRHLLDRILEGLRGNDRFRHTYILLYAVRRQPPPMWLHKLLSHGVMKELFHLLLWGEDVPVLVGAVLVLVVLLPILPLEMGTRFMDPILEVFCRLVRWTPKKEVDEAFQPFLQVAVYSLFHRLYALYPCHFIRCLRINFSKPSSARCFFSTLRPMLEKVRLHPVLITESKESEVARNRWVGLETHQRILECAKLCIDPMEATCENVCGSYFVLNSGGDMDAMPIPTNWLLYAVENNFWSPSLALSTPSAPPSVRGSTSSVPVTPVFPISTPNLKPVRVAESPPEAAIEATPDTTPFTSPIKADSGGGNSGVVSRRPVSAMCNLNLNTAMSREPQTSQNTDQETNSSPLSPVKKDHSPFKFPDDQQQDMFFMRAEKSTILQSKLKQILKERQQQPESKTDEQREAVSVKEREVSSNASVVKKVHMEKQEESMSESEALISTKSTESKSQQDLNSRRRKISMYDSRSVDLTQLGVAPEQVSGENDLELIDGEVKNEENDELSKGYRVPVRITLDRRISEEKESVSSDSRRSSDETNPCDKESDDGETLGLGVPSQRSMTDLVKNMRTMRLRFLSQCGPPPDLSQYNLVGVTRQVTSPTKPGSSPSTAIHRCLSCPDLAVEGRSQAYVAVESRVRKESAMSSLTLSPIRQAVMTSEATTQTEETSVVNPYEQLLDALQPGPPSQRNNKTSERSTKNSESSPSPHELLDQYLQLSAKAGNESRNILWQQTANSGSQYDALKNQVRLMQVMLLIERYKREVHAEHNRRLLGRAKRVYELEEQQRGLNDKVAQLESEITQLKLDLQNSETNASSKEQQLQSLLTQQQAKMSQIQVERDDAQEQRDLLKEQCSVLIKENGSLTSQLHKNQTHLLEKNRQLNVHSQMTSENEDLKNQVEVLHKQVCLMGEVQDQYKQEVWKLTVAGGPAVKVGLEQERVAAHQQIQEMEEKYRIAAAGLDAAQSQVENLEQALKDKTRQLDEQAKAATSIRDIGAEQCRAVEMRCQTLISTNQTLETFLLEQNDKIDRLVRQVRRSQRGKSVGSDGLDFDIELSVSPPSASNSGSAAGSATVSPHDELQHPPGSIMARQPIVLNKLDVLAEGEGEGDTGARRKT